MNELADRVEALRRQAAVKAEVQRAAVRAAMPADLARFVDGWKKIDPEAKLTFLHTATLTLGKAGGRGLCLRQLVIGPPDFAAPPLRGVRNQQPPKGKP